MAINVIENMREVLVAHRAPGDDAQRELGAAVVLDEPSDATRAGFFKGRS